MKTIITRAAAVAAFAVALGAPSFAQAQGDEHHSLHSNLTNPPVDLPSEAQVVGILDEVNDHEIEAAQTAVDKSRNEEVLSFARQMIVDHGEARRKLGEVGIQPARGELVNKLKEKHKSSSMRLAKLDGEAFDRAYVAAMVDGHTAVLEKLDKKLIPAAKTGALTTYVRDFRPTVEAHLEHARRIKTALGTK